MRRRLILNDNGGGVLPAIVEVNVKNPLGTTFEKIVFDTEAKEATYSTNMCGSPCSGMANFSYELELLTKNVKKVGVACGYWIYSGQQWWQFVFCTLTPENPRQTVTGSFSSPNCKCYSAYIYMVDDLINPVPDKVYV